MELETCAPHRLAFLLSFLLSKSLFGFTHFAPAPAPAPSSIHVKIPSEGDTWHSVYLRWSVGLWIPLRLLFLSIHMIEVLSALGSLEV